MKQKLLCFFMLGIMLIGSAYAQERRISGRVTSGEDGSPLEGVSVQVAGTTVSTQTDANGNYAIDATEEGTLVFNYLGYSPQSVAINDRTVINVQLAADETSIEEVVVTAMGIRRQAKSLAYSTANVNPDDMVQKSEPDMLKALQGKVAGVDIRTSQGTPGAATRFQVRGNSSFFGSNQPLVIVDGVPYDNASVETSSQTSGGAAYSTGLSQLDPNAIETMTVLKGSAAAALYGSRASNGVVIITTKAGNAKIGAPSSVSVRSSVSFENIANLPEYQNLYGAGSNFGYSNSNGSWGAPFAGRDSIPVWPTYAAAYPEMFTSPNVAYRAYPDNVKSLFNTGLVAENSVGFSGGGEHTGFNLTASHLDHQGYVQNSSFERYNFSAGGSMRFKDKFTARGNIAYSNSKQVGGYFGENQVDGAASQFARSLFLARNWDMSLPYETKDGLNLNHLGGGQFDHPTWSALNNFADSRENRVLATSGLSYEVNDWWRLDYNLGANISMLDRTERYEISSRAAEGLGQLVVDGRDHREVETTFLSSFSPKLNEKFSLNATVGFNYNQRVTERKTDVGNRFITPGIYSLTNTEQFIFNTDQYFKRRLMGVFAEATVGFNDYLFLTLTGRNDWSSTLPKESRSYFYPAVSTSFIFTDLLDINKNIINYGKVRAAWAKVGRDTDPYNLMNVYLIEQNFKGTPTGRIDTRSYNPNLTPEFSSEVELGIELGLINNRVDIDFAWYDKTSTDLLAPIQTPTSSGYTSYFTNFGKINNKGVEITLRARPLPTDGQVFWELSGVFTRNRNVVKELFEGTDRITLRGILSGTVSSYLEPDMPFGYLRGTKSMRDEEGNLLINKNNGAMIEDTEEGFVGDPNPDFKMGINNVVRYKNFTLSALFDFTKGGSLYSVTNSSYLGRGVTRDTEIRNTTAIIPGVYYDPVAEEILRDANGNKIPNQTRVTVNDLYFSPEPGTGQTFAINTATEWNIYDATVYRLRDLSLTYELPQSIFSRSNVVKGISLSFTARNLWFYAPNFPKYSNFDPEVNSFGSSTTSGVELSAAPTTKRFGFNLVATF